jgi:hypothetical protein
MMQVYRANIRLPVPCTGELDSPLKESTDEPADGESGVRWDARDEHLRQMHRGMDVPQKKCKGMRREKERPTPAYPRLLVLSTSNLPFITGIKLYKVCLNKLRLDVKPCSSTV